MKSVDFQNTWTDNFRENFLKSRPPFGTIVPKTGLFITLLNIFEEGFFAKIVNG